ncbi:unnamed protein product [Oikopleura dioica]|uniref:Uncharacterized protein n=1 Tax=Oikopleura dioica TaxID=34765 RepID=E4XLU4_OIKDI|nr:unnamed protein product [Oikopleura dioica]
MKFAFGKVRENSYLLVFWIILKFIFKPRNELPTFDIFILKKIDIQSRPTIGKRRELLRLGPVCENKEVSLNFKSSSF